MAQRFYAGQRVRLARPDSVCGVDIFYIPLGIFGEVFLIQEVHGPWGQHPNQRDCLYRCRNEQQGDWSILDNMLDAVSTRSSGSRYRLVTKGWSQELFATETLTDPQAILNDLVSQLGDTRRLSVAKGVTADRIADTGNQYTALRLE